MAAGMPLPKRIFAHGWWTKDGEKISKSLGNVIDPVELVNKYGVDPTRFFLMSEVTFGNDGDFSRRALIGRNMTRQVSREIITPQEMEAAMGRIQAAPELQTIGATDLVIEAATESEEVKKSIFRALAPHLGAGTLLASNTSSISITRLAAATDRPERFIGLHFMNPVPLMKLVEIIRGIATDAPTYETAVNFARSLGKTTANAEDFPAFIVNRVLVPMINEAIYTLYEGVGTVEAIDTAMKLGANHPMGPLELGDFIGLDTVLSIMNVLYEGLADSKYRPCPLLTKYVEAGWLGRKAGRGFYDYRGEVPVPTR
jgi:3-hydroxybutyryl-CoA dehydrogenase